MSNNNAKHTFYYLLSFVALIFIAVSVGLILFSIIDIKISDLIIRHYQEHDQQLKFAISSLIIASPIFYIVLSFIKKALQKGDLQKESVLRKWLIYAILFVSSVIMLGVFIGIINSFLSGELSNRSILKSLSILLISALIFTYYLYSLKRASFNNNKYINLFLFLSLALIISTFISAWFFIDSPQLARERRLDNLVIDKVNNIEAAVNDYYMRNKALPQSLEDLANSPDTYISNEDFINQNTNKEIEYILVDNGKFKLCTDFKTSNLDVDDKYTYVKHHHSAGYYCFPGKIWSKVEVLK